MVGDQRQGWAIFAAMGVLFLAGVGVTYWAEAAGNPPVARARRSTGGNMEGKEVRFGIAHSALFASITTAASCGAVNAMHDSFTPLGGMVPLINMQLGEIIFGGVGAGLYGMLLFVIVAVFVAGLMVGRTPEYRRQEDRGQGGQDGDARHPDPAARRSSASPRSPWCSSGPSPSIANPGPHGFTEILYAYTSATANNGTAFAGLTANTPFYNTDARPRDADRPLPR